MPSPVLAVRLPTEDADHVRQLAERRGTTVSDELRRAVREHMVNHSRSRP